MFKRANKITALLVAAAAVVSVLPATAANAADYKRIESKDGTVYDAVAYKDGKFYVDGEVEDKDEATYYVADGKFKALEDIDTGSDYTLYGSKYINVEDGDYFIDLSTGKVTDDSIKDDNEDDAASALRKKVKNDTDGRYAETNTGLGSEIIQNLSNAQLPGAKFADIWYGVKYDAKSTKDSQNGGASTFNVYTDEKGNYIDADYNLGKVKVVTTSASAKKSVTIENTNDDYDTAVSGEKLSASVTNATVIGQDANYIYRTADINVKLTTGASVSISEINGVELDADTDALTVTTDAAGRKTVVLNVIQKISKAQASDDVDGAKYAKTVTNYVFANDSGEKKALAATTPKFTVAGGKVIAYADDSVQTIELKSKNGFYYTDIKDENTDDATVFDVDVDGNLWSLDGGYIYKFDNDEDWDKIYKVDGSMDEFSVYDKNNIVAWNEEDEVYSIIGSKSSDKTDEDTTTTTTGWVETAAGSGVWNYVNADGTKATGWLNLNGTWYYLDPATGVMATGWVNVNGTWYYLNPVSDGYRGAMKTGWVNVSGTWYYLNASGAMLTGWINDNGTWYYCNASGAMLANTVVDGYKLGANGAWVK